MKRQQIALFIVIIALLSNISPLLVTSKAQDNSSKENSHQSKKTLEISIGNLSVPLLLKKWGSPLLGQGVDASQAAHKRELAQIIQDAKTVDAQKIEDYLGWAVVEPKEGQWKWDTYKENARAITSNGFKYVPFVWMQNLPHWVRYNTSFPHSSCIEHGKDSEALSIFSPKTVEFYDRFFAETKKELGSQIDILRIGTPNDFGETTYPVGNATFAFPDKHLHPGFWVNELNARHSFQTTMQAKYFTIDKLNSSWDTNFSSFDSLEYPKNASHRRWWLDFINWYHDSHTDKIGELADVVLKYFPTTPINLNFGFPDERIIYGQDLSGVTKKLAAKHLYLRTPTGSMVPFFYTKRLSTAVNYYKPAGFSSEPVDGNASLEAIASAVFKDLTTNVTFHFDYVSNLVHGKELIAQEQKLYQGIYPEIDSAIFFSTTGHRLDDSQAEQFYKGYPDNLVPLTEGLRDVIDYDVVDEQLITDGILSNYKVIIWPLNLTTEDNTLSQLHTWVENGGILVVGDLSSINTVEGNKGAFVNLDLQNEIVPLGKGFIFNAKKNINRLAEIVATRSYAQLGETSANLLPPLDWVVDNVLISYFPDGIVLFNQSNSTITKKLSMPPGVWRINYPNLPQQIELPPLAIRWINAKTGEIN